MSAEPLRERAPAKVNLTLHVVGRRADGYHELDSLVAFAAVADELTLAPGPETSLALRGPGAGELDGNGDNLILRAQAALRSQVPDLAGGKFSLLKRLPVAGGIGGGSSDAAAALRLLARANAIAADDPRLMAAARAVGSDVPVCLDPRPRLMRGAGEALSAPIDLPRLPAVLANPRVPTATAEVFRVLDRARGSATGEALQDYAPGLDRAALLAALGRGRNDLEAPARRVSPAIDAVLAACAAQPGCRLARMSGSGATVFALFDTCRASAAAARALRAAHPGWWVVPTMIG